jgi:hypothetical protein
MSSEKNIVKVDCWLLNPYGKRLKKNLCTVESYVV